MKDKTIIKLFFPITSDGKEVTEINMRRPKVKDHIKAQRLRNGGSDDEVAISMLSALTDLPEEALTDLDLLDFEQVEQAFNDFLKKPDSASGI